MSQPLAAPLENRGVIRIGGQDRVAFLQALVSNDVTKATNSQAVYAALLTPQGKFLHDMFILAHEDGFLIDCEAARVEDLLRRLSAYKLRAKVTFENALDKFDVWAVWDGETALPLSYPDPRLPSLGHRLFAAKGSPPPSGVRLTDFNAYDLHRLTLGVADGSRDMEVEKSTLAECNFDYLHGVSWDKGCYVGQELTARMHYRRLGKKGLFPVTLSGEPGKTDRTLFFRSAEAGQLRSHNGKNGLALIISDNAHQSILQKVPLNCGNIGVSPFYPDWLVVEEVP